MEGNQQQKIIIENLKEPISINDIINHFKDCGPIDDVIIYNSDNFISAEIYFKDKLSISNALKKNSTKINDSIIKLHLQENNNDIDINDINNTPPRPEHKYNTRSKSSKKNNIPNEKINQINNKKIIFDEEDEFEFKEEEINESILSNKYEKESEKEK